MRATLTFGGKTSAEGCLIIGEVAPGDKHFRKLWVYRPPPLGAATLFPLLIVSPVIVTAPSTTWNTRKAGVPLALLLATVSRSAPGPVMVRPLSISNSSVVSVIVSGVGRVKVMVSPDAALAIASRNEPGPLSS